MKIFFLYFIALGRCINRNWDLGLLRETEILQQRNRVCVRCHLWSCHNLPSSGSCHIYPGICRLYRCSQRKHLPPEICKYMYIQKHWLNIDHVYGILTLINFLNWALHLLDCHSVYIPKFVFFLLLCYKFHDEWH